MGDAVQLDARLKSRAPFILLASIGMGVVVFGMQYLMGDAFNLPTVRYGALLALIAAGMVSYAIFLKLFGAVSRRDVKGFIRRG